ncbi:MAG TPA: hypothetical protein EYN67_13895 [Flavobacteriales bacterium]|nr:hypothetical protein [Flavobacteriales bacterium]HIB77383.1 hypothetical protein [Flavobacteriales bacterium]
MPAITQTFKVSISNDPAAQAIVTGDRAMYLDMLLSEYYGKMVRQGSSFTIVGIQASLRPDPAASGIDVGLSAEVHIDYVPVTKHSKFAWNQIYKGWRAQKKLATAVGGQIRYDDLEFGWDRLEGLDRGRTSTIFGSGMSDALQEKLVLTGGSIATAGVLVGSYSMQDYYNSAYETPDPSRDPFTNTDIKDAKWGETPFPEIQTLHCSATSSASLQGPLGTALGGAITQGEIFTLPTPCHSLCGVLQIGAYIMPDDTASQDEDDFLLEVTIFVSSWNPLVFKAKKARRYSRKSSKGRSYGRNRRYSKKYRKR